MKLLLWLKIRRLQKRMKSQNVAVFQSTLDELATIGAPAISVILQELGTSTSRQILEQRMTLTHLRLVAKNSQTRLAQLQAKLHKQDALIAALGRIGSLEALDCLIGFVDERRENDPATTAILSLGDVVFDELLKRLKLRDPDNTATVIWLLTKVENRDPVPAICSVLNCESKRESEVAMNLLAVIADPRCLPAIISFYESASMSGAHEKLEKQARETILSFGITAIPALTQELMQLFTTHKQHRIAELLQKLGWEPNTAAECVAFSLPLGLPAQAVAKGKDAIPFLIEASKSDRYPLALWTDRYRACAISALALMGNSAAIAPLYRLLQDGSRHIRLNAAIALNSLHWRPQNTHDEAIWAVAGQELEQIEKLGDAAIEPLDAVLAHGERSLELIKALGATHSYLAITRLEACFPRVNNTHTILSSEVEKCDAICRALIEIGSPQCGELLVRIIRKCSEWKIDGNHCYVGIGTDLNATIHRAANAIEKLCGKAGLPLLIDLMENSLQAAEIAFETMLRMTKRHLQSVPEIVLKRMLLLETVDCIEFWDERDYGDPDRGRGCGFRRAVLKTDSLRQLARQELARRGV